MTTALHEALTPADVAAANALARRWFASRDEIPAAASGLGVWPLLAVLAAGAVEDTEAELLAALGLDADRARTLPASLLDGIRATAAVRLAVGAWAGPGLALDPDWVAGLPDGAVGSLTGDLAADKAALDAWAARGTQGLIDRMPLDLDDTVRLVIASALSVRTDWRTPFRDAFRRFASGPWAGLDCRVLEAQLHGNILRLGAMASVLTVEGEDDIDVLLALGHEDLSPHDVMARLTAAASDPGWGRSPADLEPGRRAVGVAIEEWWAETPQTAPETFVETVAFAVTEDLDLLSSAAALGLELASDSDLAQFDRLAAQALFVSQAKQTCTAEFSETGFKAAAVTAFGMAYMGGLPADPPRPHRHVRARIVFDRPFAYLVRHRPTGLFLLGGWVAEPQPR
ncbi:serpin family protein [Glycomyces sp. NPDC047369]